MYAVLIHYYPYFLIKNKKKLQNQHQLQLQHQIEKKGWEGGEGKCEREKTRIKR